MYKMVPMIHDQVIFIIINKDLGLVSNSRLIFFVASSQIVYVSVCVRARKCV